MYQRLSETLMSVSRTGANQYANANNQLPLADRRAAPSGRPLLLTDAVQIFLPPARRPVRDSGVNAIAREHGCRKRFVT
jgi:hypothetical protein